MRRFGKLVFFSAAVALAISAPERAMALPSPLDHVHTAATVHWKAGGSPALPWTNAVANMWNHNHLTADDISNSPKWVINKTWDNRTLVNSLAGARAWSHGMILAGNAVRYGWGAGVPNDARNAVEAGFGAWVTAATAQFNAKKDDTDVLALRFERVNMGDKEVTISFVESITDAVAEFNSTTRVLEFLSAPFIQLQTSGGMNRIRLGDAGVTGTTIKVPTPWSFDGTPDGTMTDFDYSVDGGATWTDAPPMGFGDISFCAATCGLTQAPTDKIEIFEFDFRTVANHELGHVIALGHTGEGSAPIMRDDIADRAAFGRTGAAIDADSALAVAIAYTYSVPEPGTLALAGCVGLGMLSLRRRVLC